MRATPARHLLRAMSAIEIAVALVIAAMLATASFASFQQIRDTSAETTARGAIEQVVIAEYGYAQRTGVFTADPVALDVPGTVTVIGGVSEGPEQVSVAVTEDGELVLAALASNGTCVSRVVEAPWDGIGFTDTLSSDVSCAAAYQ